MKDEIIVMSFIAVFVCICMISIGDLHDEVDATVISGDCGEDLTWEYDDSTYTLTISGTGAMTNYTSSNATPWAAYETVMKTVILPSGITTIGDRSFYYCSGLTGTLSIPDGVTYIGDRAFTFCTGLTGTLTIPDSVTEIGDYAFYSCTGLEALSLGSGLDTIGDRAFYNDTGLTGTLTIPDTVTEIGDYAFYSCEGLTGSLTIPDSVNEIGDNAFYYCSGFTGIITIGEGVTYIGNYAFQQCGGTSFVISPDNTAYDSKDGLLLNKNRTVLIAGPTKMTGTLTIPNEVEIIRDNAFFNCIGLTGSLTIPDATTSIGNYAFYGCNGFTGTLTLGSGITEIGDGSFYSCNNMSGTLIIPGNVVTVSSSAFASCTGFSELIISDGVETIENDAFNGCTGFAGTLDITDTVTYLGDSAFYGCSGFNGNLILSDTMSIVENNTFYGCIGFTGNLVIPESVTWIGSSAFKDCSGFNGELIIPGSVTSLGSYAFENCTGLTGTLDIPDSVTFIGEDAFDNCSGFIGSLTIPNGITTINNETFKGCTGLNGSLFIPDTVTYIGVRAFSNCTGFTSITIPGSITSFSTLAFNGLTFYAADQSTVLTQNIANLTNATFTLTASKLVKGSIPSFDMTVVGSSIVGGTVTGTGTYTSCSVVTITATANAGHTFVQWNDGDPQPVKKVTVTSDVTYVAEFAHTYSITLVATPSTGGTMSGAGAYTSGTVIDISAEANTGYRFVQWDDGITEPVRAVTVNANATYTAVFSQNEYNLTLVASPVAGGTVSGSGEYTTGTYVTITATPNAGYYFSQWNDGNTDPSRNILVSSQVTYVATFEKNEYDITVIASPAVGGTVSGAGQYDYGTSVELYADPDPGYRFVQWNDGNINQIRTVVVDSDETYTAFFSTDEYILRVVASPPTGGSVTGGGTFTMGDTTEISAAPNPGYSFTQWSDGNTDATRTITINSDLVLSAIFAPNIHSITVVASPTEGGNVYGGGTFCFGLSIEIAADPNTGYRFVQWNDGNTDMIRTIDVVSDATYTATFALDTYKVTILASPSYGGIVSGNGIFDYGDTVVITATPNDEYRFVRWNDGNTEASREISVTSDVTYTAEFANTYVLTLVASPAVGGTVTGGGTYTNNCPINIVATPNTGYAFVRWNDGNTDPSRVVAVTVNLTYTATFVETHDLIFDPNGGSAPEENISGMKPGDSINLPSYSGTKDGSDFSGWMLGDVVYKPGDRFVIGSDNELFVAQWERTSNDVMIYVLLVIIAIVAAASVAIVYIRRH